MSASAALRSNTGETELGLKSAAAVMALVLSLGCSTEPEAEAAPSTPSTEMTESNPESETPEEDMSLIRPGQSIGPVQIGVTYAELIEELGEFDNAMGYRRNILGTYAELGIEVALTSAEEFTPSLDAVVVAIGTLVGKGNFAGPILPGMSGEELDEAIGDTESDVIGNFIFLPTGISIQTNEDGGVERVGIYPAYTIRTEPPAMVPASTSLGEGVAP